VITAWPLISSHFFERVVKTNTMILGSEMHQMFERYYGFVVADENEQIKVNDLIE